MLFVLHGYGLTPLQNKGWVSVSPFIQKAATPFGGCKFWGQQNRNTPHRGLFLVLRTRVGLAEGKAVLPHLPLADIAPGAEPGWVLGGGDRERPNPVILGSAIHMLNILSLFPGVFPVWEAGSAQEFLKCLWILLISKRFTNRHAGSVPKYPHQSLR